MPIRTLLRTLSLVFLIITIGALIEVPISTAQTENEINIDLDKGKFVKIQATIMEIDPAGIFIVVAEKEIHIVDMVIDGHQFKTVLRNEQGRRVPLESFHAGKRVYVEGIEFEADRVAASVIQHLAPAQARRK